ncbi:MAG: peptide-methionine (S)-S-oxide reductase MsrA [Patescibacteria group bacterium]|nr:peptide-methionine (S)-S-oxide reductase MsrA [Patescibacteria group bacterium]
MPNELENKKEVAVFGGGCFWCTEAIFQMLQGVRSVKSGYAGGTKPNPTYEDVCTDSDGHAEVVKIEFNPAIIKFRDLLEIFFATHNPTTLNQQGNDHGGQYRSIILYATPEQKTEAENYIELLTLQNEFDKPIVTELKPLNEFYEAENYHQNYYHNNESKPYCQIIISPKLAKFKAHHPKLIN